MTERNDRLDAKRHNEQTKLTATLINNGALALVVAAIFNPLAQGTYEPSLVWIPIAAALHICARLFLMRLKSED